MYKDYYIDHLHINLHNSLSLLCTGSSTSIYILPSIYSTKAPSGPCPTSEDASIFLSSVYLLLPPIPRIPIHI